MIKPHNFSLPFRSQTFIFASHLFKMTIQTLPIEVIEKIFGLLNRDELYLCLYLCKKWYALVNPIYFREIRWTEEKISSLKKALSSTANDNIQHFKPFPITRRLTIDDIAHKTASFTKDEFLFLISRLNNLKYLNLAYSMHKESYMHILCDCRTLKLEKIVMESQNNFTNRRGIVPPVNRTVTFWYHPLLRFAMYYQFRNSLRYLCISTKGSVEVESSFVNLLAEFTALETLYLNNNSDPNLTLFQVLVACPQLSNLAYRSTLSNATKAAQELATMIQNVNNQGLPVSQFLKSLRKLELTIPTVATAYNDFLANHSPENLVDIEVNFTQFDMEENWISGKCGYSIFELCRILQKYNSVKLTFGRSSNSTFHKRCPMDNNIVYFHHLLDELVGNRNFQFSACYRLFDGSDYPIVEIDINGLKMAYIYEIGSSYSHTDQLPNPTDMKHLTKAEKFTFHTTSLDSFYLPKIYLDFLQNYCPQLAQFELYLLENPYFTAQCSKSSSTSLENMTRMTIVLFYYTLHSMPVLIEEYFPRIEVLDFFIGDLRTEDNLVLALSAFENLHTLTFDIRRSSNWRMLLRYKDSKRYMRYLIHDNLEWECFNKPEESIDPTEDICLQATIRGQIMKLVNVTVEGNNSFKKIKFKKRLSAYRTIDLD